jgi:hypothetical protein
MSPFVSQRVLPLSELLSRFRRLVNKSLTNSPAPEVQQLLHFVRLG